MSFAIAWNGRCRCCEIRFLITGGAAAIAYGDPRTTQDIDLVIEATAIQERLEQFVAQLRREKFLYNEQTVRTAVASRRQFQLLDTGSSLKLDLYPRELVPGCLGSGSPGRDHAGTHTPRG